MATLKRSESKLDTLALAAGLAKTVRQFPEDIISAAHAAATARSAMPALDDVTAEPWPPMRVRKSP